MWVVTVFEQNSYRIFEFVQQEEATKLLEIFKHSAILSYTK
ncbi:hypothetical protein [Ureibacillus manganicus]|nr:hypothetical protein [Ureibacillus manganicus]